MTTVDVRLLGGVEVALDGVLADAGYPRQRRVLAVLAVEVGRAVSPEALIDRVWGERPPRSATGSLQAYVTRLRKLFADTGVTITRRAGGYILDTGPETIDLHRFRALAAQARAAGDAEASHRYDAAFALWRGEPFTGMDTEWFRTVRTGLEAEHRRVSMDRDDVLLRTGRHGELLERLPETIGAQPLDERLVGQLMQALHLSGRQADALAEYERLRVRLAEELGSDPGPQLRAVYRRVIVGEPAVAETLAPNESVPRQVPAAPRLFTGREPEVAILDSGLETGAAAVWTIVGPGGIGKTWLALHWANRRLDRFPDGQVYIDLRGFHPTEEPIDAHAALGRVLESLGVAASAIPGDTEARAARYRSALAGKRMLVVLDNARDVAQVRGLLPGGDNATIVTSRHNLTGLGAAHGARPLRLDTWSEHQSRRALAGHIGVPRLAENASVVAELIDHCAGLPLALGILGARAAAQPGLPLSALAEELRDTAGRLDTLDESDLDIGLRAVFDGSFRALAPEAADAFVLLGIAPTSDSSLHAVASLTGQPLSRTRKLLRALETANLVEQYVPGGYRMHDLVRLYATERAESCLDAEARHAAELRLVDHYLHTVHTADRLHQPDVDNEGEEPPPPAPGCVPEPLSGPRAAHDWFGLNHDAVRAARDLAAGKNDHLRVWHFVRYSQYLIAARAWYGELVASLRVGVWTAERLADASRQALAEAYLGAALLIVGEDAEGFPLLRRVLSRPGRDFPAPHVIAWEEMAAWHHRHGDCASAFENCQRALAALGTEAAPGRRAALYNTGGWYKFELGELTEARERCATSLEILDRHAPASIQRAFSLDSLGCIAQAEGDHVTAKDHFREALRALDVRRNDWLQATCLNNLGDSCAALGEMEEAREAWNRSLTRYESLNLHAEADAVAAKLTSGVPGTPAT